MDGETRHRGRRFVWSKLTCGVLVGFLAVTVGARVWWGYHADARLRDIVDRNRARGDPLDPGELTPPPVPDERNAALLYKQGYSIPLLAAEPLEDDASPFLDDRDPLLDDTGAERLCRLGSMIGPMVRGARLRRAHVSECREIMEASREALELCRRARSLDAADWGIRCQPPPPERMPVNFGTLCELADLLALAAGVEADAGRYGEAVERVRDLLAMGASFRDAPSIPGWLAAVCLSDNAAECVQAIAPSLRVGPAPGSAPRHGVEALIRELLDEGPWRGGLRLAFLGDRSYLYASVEWFRGELRDAKPSLMHPFRLLVSGIYDLGPVYTLDEARWLALYDPYVVASREPNLPAFRRAFGEEGGAVFRIPSAFFDRATRPLSVLLAPDFRGMVAGQYRAAALRRMAAVALGVRLHELDHGNRPRRLADLVGRYVPAVPEDPLAETGTVIRYLPDARPPVLYSVNDNGTDDGGRYTPGQGGAPDPTSSADLVFLLSVPEPVGNLTP